MQPQLKLLTPELIFQIIAEAFELMLNPGIKVQLPEARNLLASAGVEIDEANEVAIIPEDVACKALETVPREFFLYDRDGNLAVHYGGNAVHFDPGSSGVNILDLVIDAEAIGMAQRMLQGMMVHTETLATEMFEGIKFKGEFLKLRVTRNLIEKEQHLPSPVIDRGSIRNWQQMGSPDAFERAKVRVAEILAAYEPPDLPSDQVAKLQNMVSGLAEAAGLDQLPVY